MRRERLTVLHGQARTQRGEPQVHAQVKKIVLGVVGTVGNLAIRGWVAGYAEAEPAMTFTLPMLFARLALGGVSSVAAGLACAAALRLPAAVSVLAALLVLFFIPVHYSLWARLPLWYHAVFLASLAPLVLLGAALARPVASRGEGAA